MRDSYSNEQRTETTSGPPNTFEDKEAILLPPPTIYKYLSARELGARPTTTHHIRHLYQRIVPNTTIHDIEVTMTSVKKFSPSGKYLICYSQCQHALQVYQVDYTGTTLLGPARGNLGFNTFFTRIYETSITTGTELLCRDFCLFTPNENYLILASAVPNLSVLAAINTTNVMAHKNPYSLDILGSLDDVTFYLVRLNDGIVADKLRFEADYVFLAHHAGVSLCGHYFAVTSIEHQIVQLFWISLEKGKFIKYGQVGYSLYIDDDLTMLRSGLDPNYYTATHSNGIDGDLGRGATVPILGFKQRLMAWLYRSALRQSNPINSIRLLYLDWNALSSICIWKAQHLDSDHLFLKLGAAEQLSGRQFESIPNVVFFVIYRISTTEIVAVFSGDDVRLYKLLCEHNEYFRIFPGIDLTQQQKEGIIASNATESGGSNYTPTISTSAEEQYWCRRHFDLLASAKNGGISTAIRRLLSALPYSPQTGSGGGLEAPLSPYLDSSLFRYDDKMVGPGDRAKPASEFPVKFFRRTDHQLAFSLEPTLPSSQNSADPTLSMRLK